MSNKKMKQILNLARITRVFNFPCAFPDVFRKIGSRFVLSIILVLALIPTLSAQNLWNDSGANFTTTGSLGIGSVIEVVFDNDLELLYEAELSKGKAGSYNNIALLQSFLGPLLGERGNALEAERSIRIRSRGRHSGGIGAVITGYNALNNTYTLNARRELALNAQERELFAFVAQVNGGDISDDRTILSSKLANLTLQYENKENNFQLTERDFERLSFPTREAIDAALALVREQELREQQELQELQRQQELQQQQGLQEPGAELGTTETAGNVAQVETQIQPDLDLGNQVQDTEIVVPEIEIELTAAKKRELFLKLLNIIINDWY